MIAMINIANILVYVLISPMSVMMTMKLNEIARI
jgi:hypothetical protein